MAVGWRRLSGCKAAIMLSVGLVLCTLSCDLLPVKKYMIRQDGMFPTFSIGSTIWAWRSPYRTVADVKPGDIVVFSIEQGGHKYDFVWRVVGLPGDRVRVRDLKVEVNGVELKHTVFSETSDFSIVWEENRGSRYRVAYQKDKPSMDRRGADLLVPAGELFLLGDNRDKAADSRYHGTIKFEWIRASVREQ